MGKMDFVDPVMVGHEAVDEGHSPELSSVRPGMNMMKAFSKHSNLLAT